MLLQSLERLLGSVLLGKLLLRRKLLLLLRGKLLLLLRSKLLLSSKLLLLLRNKLLLTSKLLLLLGSKLLLRSKLLLIGEEVSGKRINLTVLIVVPGESLQSDLIGRQLRDRNIRDRRLLRYKLRLDGALLFRQKPLLLRLLGGGKLKLLWLSLLRIELKLLLLLGSKLLLLGSKLLLPCRKLLLLGRNLLLLEGLEVLIEASLVELAAEGGGGVEVSGVEDGPTAPLLVSKGLALHSRLVFCFDLLLPCDHTLLVSNNCLVSSSLSLESRVLKRCTLL